MSTTPPDEVMFFFKTLVDPNRLKILGLVGLEPLTINQLAERLRLKPIAVMSHLSMLAQLHLVRQHDGAYSMDLGGLDTLARRVLSGSRPHLTPEDFEGEDFERKVLSDFCLPDGRFRSFPVQHKKFMVLLHHTARIFETGVQYPEKQVNEMLRRFNDDTATLRRALVDNGLLERQAGIYWKRANSA